VPVSLLWIMMIFAIHTWNSMGRPLDRTVLVMGGIVLVAVLIIAFMVPDRRKPEPPEVELASDFPVPPLDLTVPSQPRHRLRAGTAAATEVDSSSESAGALTTASNVSAKSGAKSGANARGSKDDA
jgi:NADH-quinone oxidoreductase subunit H